MKILYFGTICNLSQYEKKLTSCKKKPSVASIVFETAFLQGCSKLNADIEIYSFPMIPTYPKAKMIYWGHKQERLSCGYKCIWLRTINLPFIKQLTRRADARRIIKSWIKKNRKEECVVLTYSIPPFMAGDVVKIGRKYNVKTYAIVPDLLKDMYKNASHGFCKRLLSQIYLQKTVRIQGDYDGYIYLTEAMSEAINPQKPYIVLEGIVNENIGNWTKRSKENQMRSVMYAGGLHKKYGVLNLIDGFEMADIPNTELWLFGSGDAVDEIVMHSKENPAIRLFGRREREEVLEYELKASLLVNPRNAKDEFTKYSFPSKIMEYMCSGTPVLTTRLEGIPEEYYRYVYNVNDNTALTLAETFKQIFSLTDEDLFKKGRQAREFVLEHKNSTVQAKRVLDFLGTIDEKDIKSN